MRRHPHIRDSIGEPWRQRGKLLSTCAPTTKSATMRSTESKRSWIGSKWQGGRQAEKADSQACLL